MSNDRKKSVNMEEDKKRAIRQWGADPCGAVYAQYSFGTKEFFDAVEEYRYKKYAPWISNAIGFDRYKDKKILEVGCGMGTDLMQFARGGGLMIGLDITPKSIEITKKRFELYGLRGEFLIGDAENLPFKDNYFDLVYSFGVLHHTPDTQKAINEVYRVLKMGGEAIVMLYHRNSIYFWLDLIILRGILKGNLVRYSIEEMLSRYVEYSEIGARPLVKVYSHSEAKRLFQKFKAIEIKVYQLKGDKIPLIGKYLPKAVIRWLSGISGWNLVIKTTK